jgi:hypothetical protein
MDRVGKFSFSNRLNDTISLLSGKWLNENERNMKKIRKTKFWKKFTPAKCDNLEHSVRLLYIMTIPYHRCITKPFISIVKHAFGFEIN